MNTRKIFEELIPSSLTSEKAAGFKNIFQFNITGNDSGIWYADFTKSSDWLNEGQHPKPDITITMKDEVWMKIVLKETKPETALMLGKIKVSGSVPLALKLKALLP